MEAARPHNPSGWKHRASGPSPQEPEPITSLYNRISLSGLPASAPPRPTPAGLGLGEGSRMEDVSSGFSTRARGGVGAA